MTASLSSFIVELEKLNTAQRATLAGLTKYSVDSVNVFHIGENATIALRRDGVSTSITLTPTGSPVSAATA